MFFANRFHPAADILIVISSLNNPMPLWYDIIYNKSLTKRNLFIISPSLSCSSFPFPPFPPFLTIEIKLIKICS